MTCPNRECSQRCGATTQMHTHTHTHLNPSPLESSEILHFLLQLGRGRKAGPTSCTGSMPECKAGSSGFFLRDRLNQATKQTLSLMFGGRTKSKFTVAKHGKNLVILPFILQGN